MFVHFNGVIHNVEEVSSVDCREYVETGSIKIAWKDPTFHESTVSGPEATNIIMALCPSVLEGKQARYRRNAWAIHNLIGHPLMQLLSWIGLTRLGIKVHDATVPDESHE